MQLQIIRISNSGWQAEFCGQADDGGETRPI